MPDNSPDARTIRLDGSRAETASTSKSSNENPASPKPLPMIWKSTVADGPEAIKVADSVTKPIPGTPSVGFLGMGTPFTEIVVPSAYALHVSGVQASVKLPSQKLTVY